MTVNSFDPSALGGALDTALADELCALAEKASSDDELLSEDQAMRFSVLASHTGWQAYAERLNDEQIGHLIRLFTLAEMKFGGWKAGDQSPVIGLVKVLKQRGTFATVLTRWIKGNTDNKFLPHGSLKDLL